SRDWRGGTVSATTPTLNRIAITTEGDGPGMVLVSESYDPGWKAFSHGLELPVRRADALIMAVEVPPGKQEVELRYEPRLWRWGLAGSGLSLLAVGFWGGIAWRRRRRPSV
ncbi:MAG: YfhO family protein, partial [Candidatus Sericytochromatia bacterium]